MQLPTALGISLGPLAVLVAASAGAVAQGLATRPAAPSVDDAIAQFRALRRPRADDATSQAVAEVLQGVATESLGVADVEKLCAARMLQLAPDALRVRYAARLSELAKDAGLDGAVAGALHLVVLPRVSRTEAGKPGAASRPSEVKVLVAAVAHPHARDALRLGRGAALFGNLWRFSTEELARSGALATLAGWADEQFRPEGARDLLELLDHALKPESGLDAKERERLRQAGVAVLTKAIALHPQDGVEARYLTHRKEQLEGALALGKLLGSEAPRVDVLWTNDPAKPKAFADLRGKVVVVDFFATWCVPCIAEFPHVRELVARYAGKPVAFVGITSVQGYHVDPKATDAAQKRTDTKGDPEREFALMGEFVTKMEMTWPVWFTRQYVFNPDFGIRSIPHVAVVDAKGIVRWNGVAPGDLAARIDELLAEGPASRAVGK